MICTTNNHYEIDIFVHSRKSLPNAYTKYGEGFRYYATITAEKPVRSTSKVYLSENEHTYDTVSLCSHNVKSSLQV